MSMFNIYYSYFTGRIMKKIILIVVFGLLFSTLALSDEYSDYVIKGDHFWTNRDDQASLLKAIELYEKALSLKPGDEALLALIIRAYYWKGVNVPDTEKTKRMAAFRKGMDYGEKLLEINPVNIAGNYWYASNKAMFGADRGVLKSLSYLSDLKEKIDFVLENDRMYFYGAVHRFYAKLSESVPGLFRKSLTGYSLKDAEKLLKEAIQIEYNFATSHLFLGDIYMAMGKPKLAKKEYEIVLKISEDSLPECAAEIRRDKETVLISLNRFK